jgi:hypothetical protein
MELRANGSSLVHSKAKPRPKLKAAARRKLAAECADRIVSKLEAARQLTTIPRLTKSLRAFGLFSPEVRESLAGLLDSRPNAPPLAVACRDAKTGQCNKVMVRLVRLLGLLWTYSTRRRPVPEEFDYLTAAELLEDYVSELDPRDEASPPANQEQAVACCDSVEDPVDGSTTPNMTPLDPGAKHDHSTKKNNGGREPLWEGLVLFDAEYKKGNSGASDTEVCKAYRRKYAVRAKDNPGRPSPRDLQNARQYRKQRDSSHEVTPTGNGTENPAKM